MTIISHCGVVPTVDATAWVAPDATLCGDVHIGAHTRVMHGARIIAEGGAIHIGAYCGATVPIGWVGVGEPIKILPPDRRDEIWRVQKPLNFPLHVYGFERAEADMVKITKRLCDELGEHRNDETVRS